MDGKSTYSEEINIGLLVILLLPHFKVLNETMTVSSKKMCIDKKERKKRFRIRLMQVVDLPCWRSCRQHPTRKERYN